LDQNWALADISATEFNQILKKKLKNHSFCLKKASRFVNGGTFTEKMLLQLQLVDGGG
jgi:hypothetical protein